MLSLQHLVQGLARRGHLASLLSERGDDISPAGRARLEKGEDVEKLELVCIADGTETVRALACASSSGRLNTGSP